MKATYLVILFLSILLVSCKTDYKNEDCIPKDRFEFVDWFQEKLSIEDKLKIATNDINYENYATLIDWLSDKWQAPNHSIISALKTYKNYLLNYSDIPGNSDYDENSVYEINSHFAKSKYYLTFKYNNIPSLDSLNINKDKLPVPQLRIVSEHYVELLKIGLITNVKELASLYKSSAKAIMKINNLSSNSLYDIPSTKKYLLIPIIEYPKVYDFIPKRQANSGSSIKVPVK